MQSEIFTALKNISFLANLPDESLETLASKAKSAKFPKHATIIAEGDQTSSLYIILSGKVRVFSTDEESKEITLMMQEPGTHFGELALLSNEPRSASVETLEKTVCGVISKQDFLTWLAQQHPDVAIALLGVLAEKIRYLTEKVKVMALKNVYQRTVRLIYEMAQKEGDSLVIHDWPSQEKLGKMVGASREMINKVMHQLTKGTYIIIEDKTLRIERSLPASW